MFSIFGKKGKSNKKSSKSKIDENWNNVHKKVSCIYKGLERIISDLNQITHHNSFLKTFDKENKMITQHFDCFYEEIGYILETIERLENIHGFEKVEFDLKKLWPPESSYPKSAFMLEVCKHIDSFLSIYDEKIKTKMKSSPVKQEESNEIKQGVKLGSQNELRFEPGQIGQDLLQTSRLLQLRLGGFYDLLMEIEDGIFMLEHDKVPLASSNNYSAKSTSDLIEVVKNGYILKYFESNINCIYGTIEKSKIEVVILGSKFGAKVVEKRKSKKESSITTFEDIEKCFQDIYKELAALQQDVDKLFELV